MSGAFDPSSAVAVDDAPQAGASQGFDPSTAEMIDDATSAPVAQPETAGRVASLTGRALAAGTADTAGTLGRLLANPQGLMTDALNTGLRLGSQAAHALRGDANSPAPQATATNPASVATDAADKYAPQLSDFIHPAKWKEAVDYLADKAGLAKPETPGERIYSKAVEGVPSVALAPQAPVLGALSAAAGGAASQGAAEAGWSPVAQTLAGLGVGSIPSLAGSAAAGLTRVAARGTDAAAAQARIADAAASGTPLTVGQVTGSPLLQRVEGTSSKLWGGGPIKDTAERQTANLGNHVEDIVDNLAQGGDVSPTGAGTAINAGGAATKANMRAAEKAAYGKVDQLVPPDAPIDVSGTLAKLDQLATPTPGAAATTGALISPKIAAMRDNLRADIAANGGNPQLPYSAATDLKTALGNSVDWGFAPADPVSNGALKLVHGALKGDIDAGAAAISPEASQAVTDARALYAANSDRRDFLNGIIDKAGGPEAVYAAATNGTKQGATKIGGIMSALDPGQQNLVRATVIDRLGKALPYQQNAAGSTFNPSTFLTNWNKLDAAAKDALFGASGAPKTLRASLDSLAKTTSTIRNSTVFKNPSGTAEAAGHGVGLASLIHGGNAALAGHPGTLAAAVGGIAGNNVIARALTNPRTAAWLAATTKLPLAALPNAVNQLGQLANGTGDQDARDLASYLQSQR